MKGKFLFVLLTALAFACETEPEKSPNMEEDMRKILTDNIEVISYDGCEYLILKHDADGNSAYGFMAHKGNCANPIHEHNSIGDE